MIGIIGFGSWGTALSVACSYNKKNILVWVRNKKQKYFFKKFFFNVKYTNNLKLNNNISLTLDLKIFLKKTDVLLFAIPSFVFKNLLLDFTNKIKDYHKIVISCKGFFKGIFFHNIILSKFKNKKIAILTGPTFAKEIIKKKHTAINIASNDKNLLLYLLLSFHSNVFHVYSSTDLVGLQLSCIYKNILSFITGMIEKLNFGENARSVLITYGLSEFKILLNLVKGRNATIFSMGAIGDIVLTCTSKTSRNYMFGYNLADNKNSKLLKISSNNTIESANNISCLLFLAKKYNIKFILAKEVKNIIKNNNSSLNCMKKIFSLK